MEERDCAELRHHVHIPTAREDAALLFGFGAEIARRAECRDVLRARPVRALGEVDRRAADADLHCGEAVVRRPVERLQPVGDQVAVGIVAERAARDRSRRARARRCAGRIEIGSGDAAARQDIAGIVTGEIFLPRRIAVIVSAGQAVEIVVFVISVAVLAERKNLRDAPGGVKMVSVVGQSRPGGAFRLHADQPAVGGMVG